ncbi:tubby C-terminal-like domain-containing protein, partial [Pavlovales sp. CCMP2436]
HRLTLPTWSDQLQSYTLEYNGRATEPSVKNIQLVESQNSPDLKFQLGKVGADRFNVDYKRPYSALQAFAIAVAVFDDKLFCSPAPPLLRHALQLRDKLFHRSS